MCCPRTLFFLQIAFKPTPRESPRRCSMARAHLYEPGPYPTLPSILSPTEHRSLPLMTAPIPAFRFHPQRDSPTIPSILNLLLGSHPQAPRRNRTGLRDSHSQQLAFAGIIQYTLQILLCTQNIRFWPFTGFSPAHTE